MFHFHTVAGRELGHQQLHPARREVRQALQDLPRALRRRRVGPHQARARSSCSGCSDGYKVYTDTSWAVGFGARWLLTEIEKHGRRRRPRVLRLRRAVVGLRQRVLEAQRHPRHLAGAQGPGLLAELRGGLRDAWLTRPRPRRPAAAGRAAVARRARRRRRRRTAAARAARRRRPVGRAVPVGARAAADGALARRVRRRLAVHGARRRAAARRCTATTSSSARSRCRRGRGSTTCRPPTASRTGRSRCCTWTRSPRRWCRSASTGTRTEQCGFCGIELTRGEQTIPVKTPAQLAEVCTAARDYDHAVDVTLTTGSMNRRDRGAIYISRCAAAIKEACGLPIQVQFEPPDDLRVLDEVRARRRRRGRHPRRDVRPATCSRAWRAGQGAVRRSRATSACWERAVDVFGRGSVTTYVLLGMGERPGADRRGLPARDRDGRLPVRRAAAAGARAR